MLSLRYSTRVFFKNSLLKQTQNGNYIDDGVRRAGNYQRPRLSPMPQDQMRTLKEEFLKNCSQLIPEKWHELRTNFICKFKQINQNNIDATILGLCNEPEYLPLAKDYVSYLQKVGINPNTATLGRLLKVYNAVYQNSGMLTKEEEHEVISICDKIRQTHDILDALTCEYLIYGLVATQDRWREALDLLKMSKLTAYPGISVYIQIIIKAFSLNEMELGWNLLEEMVKQGKQPKCEIYTTLLDVISKNTEDFEKNFTRLLCFLEKHQLVLTQMVAKHIETFAKAAKLSFDAKVTQVNRIGECTNCKQHMKSLAVSEKDFEKLRDTFLQKVLVRKDVFQKSTPKEIENFKVFVDETSPYDCVIDGLNVAFSKGSKKSTKELADLLVAVVRYFKNNKKRLLVLGRKHMDKWPKNSMKYIRDHAYIFLTNNLTHDDPFMLYATLKSGPKTDFFSRDLMRSHAHLLGGELKTIFRRWQQEHQFSLVTQTSSGKVIIKEPIRYLFCAQKVNNTWHIPLIPTYTAHMPDTFEPPESWLCIEPKKKMNK